MTACGGANRRVRQTRSVYSRFNAKRVMPRIRKPRWSHPRHFGITEPHCSEATNAIVVRSPTTIARTRDGDSEHTSLFLQCRDRNGRRDDIVSEAHGTHHRYLEPERNVPNRHRPPAYLSARRETLFTLLARECVGCCLREARLHPRDNRPRLTPALSAKHPRAARSQSRLHRRRATGRACVLWAPQVRLEVDF